jgi:phosphohistidine phosphatase
VATRSAKLDLYLVRHAVAGHAASDRWPDDAARPLTPDGAQRFRPAARGLRHVVPSVDLVLASSYVRAWQTAELLHDVAGWPEPVPCVLLEADRAPSEALDELKARTEGAIGLVGHEPYLSRLASLLCTGDEDALQLELKKGAVAALRFDGTVTPGDGTLRWSVSPKILRALARDGG